MIFNELEQAELRIKLEALFEATTVEEAQRKLFALEFSAAGIIDEYVQDDCYDEAIARHEENKWYESNSF